MAGTLFRRVRLHARLSRSISMSLTGVVSPASTWRTQLRRMFRKNVPASSFPCYPLPATRYSSPVIHPTAIISADAQLADDVEVGPYAVIEGPVELAAGVKVDGHALLRGQVKIGGRCTIGWGAVIGNDPQDLGFDPATSSGVEIGSDNTIREYVTIHRGSKPGSATRVGDRNFLMAGCHLGHDVTLGSDAAIANGTLVGGHVKIGDRCFLGGGAGFHQFVHIGSLSIVQGNARITQDVPPFCIAHSANVLAGLNVIGLRRAGFDQAARSELKRLFRLLFRSGLTLSDAIKQASAEPWSDSARPLLEAAANPSSKGIMTRR
jgi:UDP-N-acetylglucosamine acyltransferase